MSREVVADEGTAGDQFNDTENTVVETAEEEFKRRWA